MKTGIGDRRRLIALIASLLTLGFAGTSFFGFMASRQALEASIADNELPVTSDTVYSEIQRDLVRPILISSMMASDTFLRDWILAGEKTPAEMIKYLGQVRTKYDAFTSFMVSERTRIYYQSDRILKKVSGSEDRDVWYFRVRLMKTPYEINVDRDLAHADTLTVFINYRVLDYHGRFIGAAGVGINVAAISGMTAEYRQKYGRSVYFVDKDGNIVAGSPGGIDFGDNAAPKNIRRHRRTVEHRFPRPLRRSRLLPIHEGGQRVASQRAYGERARLAALRGKGRKRGLSGDSQGPRAQSRDMPRHHRPRSLADELDHQPFPIPARADGHPGRTYRLPQPARAGHPRGSGIKGNEARRPLALPRHRRPG